MTLCVDVLPFEQVEKLLEGFIADLGISPEQLAEVCSPDSNIEKDLEVCINETSTPSFSTINQALH